MELMLKSSEINYLLSFIGERSLFGIGVVLDDAGALVSLTKKGIVEKDGGPNEKTMLIVEMLKAYKQAEFYLRFQNFVFALLEDGHCIINKKIYGEYEEDLNLQDDYDQFFIGDYRILLNVMLSHPILRRQYMNIGVSDGINSNLIIELYDQKEELLKELRMEIEGNHCYKLNEHFEREGKIEEVNIVEWLIDNLPETYSAELKGAIEYEQGTDL